MTKEGGLRIGPLYIGGRSSEAELVPSRNLIPPFKDIPDITPWIAEPKGFWERRKVKKLKTFYESEADAFAHLAIKKGWTDQPALIPRELPTFLLALFLKNLETRATRFEYRKIRTALESFDDQRIGKFLKGVHEPERWRKSLQNLAKFCFTQAPDDTRSITELFDFEILKGNRPKVIRLEA